MTPTLPLPFRAAMTALWATTVLLALPVASARAQEDGPTVENAAKAGERITQVIVYGEDPCKPSNENEIVVCVRQAERERYRIPANLRDNPNDPKNQAWLARARSIEYVGRSGAQSCSPVGAGGFTGCFTKMAEEAKAERKMLDNADWVRLIEEERAKRMGTIDAESKEIEARVKAEEAADKARQEQQEATPPPATQPAR